MTGRHILTFGVRGPFRRWLALAALTTSILLATAGLAACSSNNATAVPRPTATTGSIQVTVDRTTYIASQAIGVTVSNAASKTDYYALTGKSVCTYIQLQQYNSTTKTWDPVDGCQNTDQPRVLQIPHAASIPYTLAPQSPANQNQWNPGTYRIALAYTTDSTGSTGMQTAYSPGFTISAH